MSTLASRAGSAGLGPRPPIAAAARPMTATKQNGGGDMPPLPDNHPFEMYKARLGRLEEAFAARRLAPRHLVSDCVRVLEDLLLSAALVFLESRQPASLSALRVAHAQASALERLRDAEIVSPWTSRQVDEARKLAKWCLSSSARSVPSETAHNLLRLVQRLVEQMEGFVQCALEGKPRSGCPAGHAYCRDMLPQHLDVVGGPHDAHLFRAARPASGSTEESPDGAGAVAPAGGLANPESQKLRPRPRAHDALPYGWSRAQFEAQCAPLHNTAVLELQQLEEEEAEREREEAEARAAERAEKIRLREEAAERRRQRREEEAARLARNSAPQDELSDLDEDPEEVDSEEERLTARRAAARAEAGEGAPLEEEIVSSDQSDDDEETLAERQARREAIAARQAADLEDEKLANEEIPAPVLPPARFAFTFCCIVCHSVLLRARDLQRVQGNMVWTKPGRNLAGKSLLKNGADVWRSRPADERAPGESGMEGDSDEEEEEEEAEQDEEEAADELDPDNVKDEGAAKREESVGVHCMGCDYYVGRYFPQREQFRLIYIHRASGTNFMYHTGDASVSRLQPLIRQRSEEEEEEEERRLAEEEEQGSDEDEEAFQARRDAARKAREDAPVPQLVGLPAAYEDERQAAQYPFPRFGSTAPYNRPSSWQLFCAALTKRAELSEADAKKAQALASPKAGSKAATKQNSKTFRPGLPYLPELWANLRAVPDSHYDLPLQSEEEGEKEVSVDLALLLWSDRAFHNRRGMDALTRRLQALFATFPQGTIYADVNKPVVPVFTHFFLPSHADFTQERGTARYVFHYLTRKDDSKLKRQSYSYAKFLRAVNKHENGVWHLTAGGWGGHRFVLAKVGAAYRILQSNSGLLAAKDRYTLLQWLASDYPWSRTLDRGELLAFLAKFEEARRGRKAIWEELFCAGRAAEVGHDASDTWQPDQVFFCGAKMLDFAIQL